MIIDTFGPNTILYKTTSVNELINKFFNSDMRLKEFIFNLYEIEKFRQFDMRGDDYLYNTESWRKESIKFEKELRQRIEILMENLHNNLVFVWK